MKCVDTEQLKIYSEGKLDAAAMVEVSEHLKNCDICKAAFCELCSAEALGYEIAADILGVDDCPEYEELCDIVENSTASKSNGRILSHVNRCEACSNDLARIYELRSHAAMREKIVVKPGMSRTAPAGFPAWRRIAAAVALPAALALIAFGVISNRPDVDGPKNQVASTKEPIKHNSSPGGNKPEVKNKNTDVVAAVPARPEVAIPYPAATPKPEVLLKDGKYRLIKSGSATRLVKVSAEDVDAAADDRLSSAIAAKVATGALKLAKPVQAAMAAIATRDGDEYTPPPTAPEISEPNGVILRSASPELKWSDVELADSYRVRVYDNAGKLVYENVVSGNSHRVTEKLVRGQVYAWRVGVRFSESDSWADSSAAKFKILSTEDDAWLREVESNNGGSHLALGAAYESVGLFSDAIDQYRQLRRQNPSSKQAERLLHNTAESARSIQ